MNRKLLVAIVSGVLAAPMAAQVQADEMESELHEHSATVYGSLRYGVTVNDDGDDTTWDTGSNHGSRFGIKGTTGAGAGFTAGFHIERNLDADLSARLHNVSLSGDFGTVKLGQQDAPYYYATTWDEAAQLGGGTDVGSRVEGASFSSNPGGPFSFSVLANDGGSDGNDGNGADYIEATGSLSVGAISLSGGFMRQADDGERIGGAVGGAMAGIDLKVGFESATDITCTAAMAVSVTHDVMEADNHKETATSPEFCDEDRYGFHMGYTHSGGEPGGGTAYVQFGDRDSDVGKRDLSYWLFGYQHYVSTKVTVQAVHRIKEEGDPGADDSTSVLVLKVDF